MNMKSKIVAAIFAALIFSTVARADEGMWMVNAIDKAVHANMKARGCKLKANEIYNADARGASICDAIVSLDFQCTGSIISKGSLVITNHHCAYGDVHALSTPEKNYLEEGFWAYSREEEIPIPGKRMLLLKRVLDVTDEMNALLEGELKGKLFASRIAGTRFEQKYAGPGEEAYLSSMWKGSKYYLGIYTVYKDIRLVAAPPVSIAAYGGDIDNWEWPQHKGDFSIYRIYAAPDGTPAEYSESNVPLQSGKKIEISTKGIREGDYTMVIGFPGVTHRYNSSYKTEYERYIKLPIETDIRREVLNIMDEWMDKDPLIRLKYADKYFSLSNGCELYEGEILCYDRFKVIDEARGREEDLQQWIDSDRERSERWGDLLENLRAAYKATDNAEIQLEYYRESVIRATQLYALSTRVSGLARPNCKPETVKEYLNSFFESNDMNVERDLFSLSVATFYANVDSTLWGPAHKKAYYKFNGDPALIADYIWKSSWITDPEAVQDFMECTNPADYADDALVHYFTDSKFQDYNNAVLNAWKGTKIADLEKEYTQAFYQMNIEKGRAQYPDANSTMRLTYGTVGGFSPRDGVVYGWHTTTKGILEKYNPSDYDFNLKSEWKSLLERGDANMPVNFVTDNDITGGNSGSPVLDAKGQLVGLAFDGNKESLAGDVSFTPGYNKCVCVDIRYVMWILSNYAHLDRILDEINE